VYQRALSHQGSRAWPGMPRFSSLVAATGHGVLSEIDGQALCYPAFALVVRLRKPYKDGVNHGPLPRWAQPKGRGLGERAAGMGRQ
jgi:hypothetical protein